MIERILLVAGRELGATLLTRAFITMVLAPLISMLLIPLVLAPIVFFSTDGPPTGDGGTAPEPQATRIELVDPTGSVDGPLADALGDRWEVVEVDGTTPLVDTRTRYRLVFGADARVAGRYTLEVQADLSRRAREREVPPIERAADQALGHLRLVEAGLEEDAVATALAVEHEVVQVDKPFDPVATWGRVHGYAMPAGVLFLMFAALSMAGQGLLTSTLEEKSTRVAEVLLGAVSPVELLTGKVLGQLGVSLILALLWGGPTLVLLALTASFVVGPLQLLYLLAFIGIASLSWAAVMGGIGSAVNDLTEAQHILAPLFMVMMVFFLPALFAITAPSAPSSVWLSMVPPTAAPVMAARIVSTEPAPHWQVWIALASSGAFAAFLLWAAGRLFRIGLLLRSSPPNLRTLLRWVLSG